VNTIDFEALDHIRQRAASTPVHTDRYGGKWITRTVAALAGHQAVIDRQALIEYIDSIAAQSAAVTEREVQA
jgi:hypothetical protein